jgi:glycosyltransferase family protein
MPTVIVFSKDRPMQLHGYLESLLLFSDVVEGDIAVLFNQTPQIDYKRVISSFPGIKWVEEKNFHLDLVGMIEVSDDYIMFGCDDVVFRAPFSLNFAKDILKNGDDIFGFSLRLGKNIQPAPKDFLASTEYLKWNWQTSTEQHYSYPWELDCTLYRKADIQEMLASYGNPIKSPNYFEGDFAKEPRKYISRPCLACFNEVSKAIVITVNAVQDTHQNGFDSKKLTDIFSLSTLYNVQNNKLDIKSIANIKSNQIHVGSEFFLLENYDKNWESFRAREVPKKKSNPFKVFIKNIGYLFKYDLKKIARDSVGRGEFNLVLDGLHYEMSCDLRNMNNPSILPPKETISELVRKRASFCRFGDGEFILMGGEGIAFQGPDARLTRRLNEIFRSNFDNIFIGIPHCYYSTVQDMRDFPKAFIRSWVAKYRNKITSLTVPGKQYFDTGCTQLYALFKNYDFKDYFSKITDIWRERDIVIICGNSVFDLIENNIFDCARTIEYQYAPSINAFDCYDQILERAKSWDHDKLIIIILGPTATVLAFDLAKLGYQALDFGHIAKDYEFFCKKIEHNDQTISNFFKPD